MMVPVQLPVPSGFLSLVVHLPAAGVDYKGWVLHVPAFAEEMNRSRVMVARQARELANLGYAVVVPDLTACGDSTGELAGVTWTRWRQDIETILSWIAGQGGGDVCLWGLRLGCLLALQVARANRGGISQLILWQPVTTARQHINQFLRLQMAAGLLTGGGESTGSLREKLEAGLTIEVAGYALPPGLVLEVDALAAESLVPPRDSRVAWLEVSSGEERALSPTSQAVIKAWSAQGVSVQAEAVPGEPFWAAQERAHAPELVACSINYLQQWPAGRCASIGLGPKGDPANRAKEAPVVFECGGDELFGVHHEGDPAATTGVLVIVGGPQYRAGSHRQFVYLARTLAASGVPVFRFDYRGMGDSAGAFSGYPGIEQDIRVAIDRFTKLNPSVTRVVLWGLCDAATAAAFYARSDQRVSGLVLANPWVWSERGEAKAYLRHYYARRLLTGDFWKKVFRGRFDAVDSLRGLVGNARKGLGGARSGGLGAECKEGPGESGELAERMYLSLERTSIPVLFILSGHDLTAAQFRDATKEHPGWRKLLGEQRVTVRELREADHTFSTRAWRNQVSAWTGEWIDRGESPAL